MKIAMRRNEGLFQVEQSQQQGNRVGTAGECDDGQGTKGRLGEGGMEMFEEHGEQSTENRVQRTTTMRDNSAVAIFPFSF